MMAWSNSSRGAFCAVMLMLTALVCNSQAQTTVCGTESGIWTVDGSPYLVACDVTVPSGETLSIEPGVSVLLFEGVSINVEGSFSQ